MNRKSQYNQQGRHFPYWCFYGFLSPIQFCLQVLPSILELLTKSGSVYTYLLSLINRVQHFSTENELYLAWQHTENGNKDEFQYSVLHKDDNFKLILIYWNGNSRSKKHGHMKGGGLMRILSGEVIETRFDSEDCVFLVGNFQLP